MRLHDVDGRDKPGHDAGATDVASPVSSKGTGRRPVRTRKARLPADSRMRLPGRPRLQIVSVPAFAAAYRWPIRGQLSTLHQAARYSGRRF